MWCPDYGTGHEVSDMWWGIGKELKGLLLHPLTNGILVIIQVLIEATEESNKTKLRGV
jgi:hypothetical protein